VHTLDLFNYQTAIGENLLTYIRLKGYSKSSFSRLTGISRPTLNQIFEGCSPNPGIYNQQMEQITKTLALPLDYFLTRPEIETEKWREPVIQYSDRAVDEKRDPVVHALLSDLDELTDIASLYL
jgi:transcriptional regulator with XRE-family HTH domain